jgi:hypothetical protein
MNRRTLFALVLACIASLLLPTSPAAADEVTKQGRGVYDQLWFSNQDNRLVFKMYAPGGARCRIDSISVSFRDRDGTRYRLAGFCDGGEWTEQLNRRRRVIDCDGLRLVYKPADGFWRGVVDRDCLRRLANKVRVTKSRVDTGTEVGRVGRTRYVARG